MLARIALVFLAVVSAASVFSLHEGEAQAQPYARRHYYARPYYRPHARVVAYYPAGFYLGGGLTATRILAQQGGEELLESGAGFTFFSGLRLNRALALEAGWTGTLHNPRAVTTPFGNDVDHLVLNGFTADAKVFFPGSNQSVEPYVQAGVGLYLLDSTFFGAQSVGTGFQAGGGFLYSLGEHVDLGVRALYRGIAMGPPETGYADTFVSGLSLEANLGFQF